MGKDTRVTYKRRHAYATKSNRRQVIRTPGTCRRLSRIERAVY